jgi:hypothetical protein
MDRTDMRGLTVCESHLICGTFGDWLNSEMWKGSL